MLMQLNTVQWISLPSETRSKLVEVFNIPRSGNTEVEDQTVVTDGYTHRDLSTITIEKMQGFLLDTIEDDYFKLFHRVLDAIKPPEITLEDSIEIEETATEAVIINTNDIIQDETKEGEQIEGSNSAGNPPKGRTRTKEKKG